ncbi:GNAT family N-acetyltransferase [Tistrella bauzanensis]|uniref:GNAT family N-acetyltransferase n=1 Tax=Tistrella TaxID=171436 RepID=UPI0031F6D4AD
MNQMEHEAPLAVDITIRRATVADVPDLWALLRDLAVEEGLGARFTATIDDMRRDGFGPRPRFTAALARASAGDVLGFASWFPLYSSIRARDYLFLDNLYVRPQARGGGGRVARLLIAHVAADAVVWQADRLELHVRQPNDRARRFYTRTGIDATGVIVHGAGSDGLARLAADGEAG